MQPYNRRPDGEGRQARQPAATERAGAGSRRSAGAEAARRSALVLGGGGFTGGVYEIGALRALDLLSVNRTVNEFDVYVGTSAGAFVAAAVANGVTPEEMMRVIVQQVPTPFPDARVELAAAGRTTRSSSRRGCAAPVRVARLLRIADPRPGPDLRGRPRRRTGRGAALGAVLRRGDRALRADDPVRSGPHRRLPAARATSSTWPPPTSTPASGSCSAPRVGTTCRSPPRSAPRARCR